MNKNTCNLSFIIIPFLYVFHFQLEPKSLSPTDKATDSYNKIQYFDKYIISFCLRNVTDINKTLKESLRVLKEGGEFFCLEFSTVDLPVLNSIYSTYKNNFIPLLGQYITSQKNAYKYLSESINNFPNQEILSGKLAKTGYKEISYNNLFGGIVSIHKGWKI